MAGDIEKCEDRFNKAKMVHGVLRQVAETKGVDLSTYVYKSVCICMLLKCILAPHSMLK